MALHVAMERHDLLRDAVFAASVFHRDGWRAGVIESDAEWPVSARVCDRPRAG